MFGFLFGSSGAKKPPAGTYGPPTGEVDLDVAQRLAAHYARHPRCTRAWAESTWGGTRCYYCERGI